VTTPEQTRAAVDAYADAWNKNDRDAFIALWADDAVHVDPVPSPPNVGPAAIGTFWDNTHQLAEAIEFIVHDAIVCGSEAAVRFTVEARSGDGGMAIHGIDTFIVDDDGKIASAKAYWDPANMEILGP
jgi:steroid delta-isomerase